MNIFILCGGRGKRLRPLTWMCPKQFVPVGDDLLLFNLMNHLQQYVSGQIYINASYKFKIFEKAFKYKDITLVKETRPLGEKGSLKHFLKLYPHIKNDWLLVVNGDTLTNLYLY